MKCGIPEQKDSDTSDEFVANVSEIFNQGQQVLEYEENIYFVDNFSKSIKKYNKKNKSTSTISRNNKYLYENNLYVVRNKLLYSINNITYYMDLENFKSEKFTEGKLVYVNDNVYIYILQEGSLQYLYISSYDNTNFKKTSDMFYNLAKGYKIKYLKESDDLIFFSSLNTDASTTLFSINLENYEVTLLAREKSELPATLRIEVTDAVKKDNDVYYTIANIYTTTERELVSDYDLYVRPIDSTYSELLRKDVANFVINVDGDLVYGKKVLNYNKYNWEILYDNKKFDNWLEYIKGDISIYFMLDDLNLYFNGEKLMTFDSVYEDFSIKYATYCNGYIYILLENGVSSSLCSFKKDGSEFNKIY